MKIEHVAIYVNDLELMRDFFISFFNASSNSGYRNPKTGLRTYFLTFDDGTRLEIMNRPGMQDFEKGLMQTGYIHLAFSVGSKEEVDELTMKLKKHGYSVLSEPRNRGWVL